MHPARTSGHTTFRRVLLAGSLVSIIATMLAGVLAPRSELAQILGMLSLLCLPVVILGLLGSVIVRHEQCERSRRLALASVLARPSRAHLLLKPSFRMVVVATMKLVVAACLQLLAVSISQSCGCEVVTLSMGAVMYFFGLSFMVGGMRNASEYMLMRDAWREAKFRRVRQ